MLMALLGSACGGGAEQTAAAPSGESSQSESPEPYFTPNIVVPKTKGLAKSFGFCDQAKAWALLAGATSRASQGSPPEIFGAEAEQFVHATQGLRDGVPDAQEPLFTRLFEQNLALQRAYEEVGYDPAKADAAAKRLGRKVSATTRDALSFLGERCDVTEQDFAKGAQMFEEGKI
jgi:hypothetical protein